MACGKTAIQTHTLLTHKQCCMPNIRNEYFSSQKNKKKCSKNYLDLDRTFKVEIAEYCTETKKNPET